MQLGEDYYKKIITLILNTFENIFEGDIRFIDKQISNNHMGYFKIMYKYLPLEYDLVFENERNSFVIDIFDVEGGKNTLYRIEKYNNELSSDNIQNAIYKLRTILKKNEFCFYIYKDEKIYKKVNGQYLRVKDLNEMR